MTNQKEPYTPSLEYRIATSKSAKATGRFIGGMTYGLYHAITFPLRIATGTRRGINWCESVRSKKAGTTIEEKGNIMGAPQALFFLYRTINYAIETAQDGNYIPAAILATTNALSVGFEIGRAVHNSRCQRKSQLEQIESNTTDQ